MVFWQRSVSIVQNLDGQLPRPAKGNSCLLIKDHQSTDDHRCYSAPQTGSDSNSISASLRLVLYRAAQISTISLWGGQLFHTTLSLVTMSTRTDWSKPEHTHRPCLSGLQSRLAIGWVDRVTFCKRLTEPATPTSTSSESFLLLWAGYSLVMTSQKVFYRLHYSKAGNFYSYKTTIMMSTYVSWNGINVVVVKDGWLTISIDVCCLLLLQS